jgi:lipoprotein NlpI
MLRKDCGFAGVLVLFMIFSSLPAASADDCTNSSGDVAIAACSDRISSGKFKGHSQAANYYNRGIEYNNKGDTARAIADYNQAISLDPKLASAYNNRGNIYQRKGDYDRAIADYNQTISLDPKFTNAYNNRGNIYYYKGDYDRAIADYNQAISLNPKLASAYDNRGSAFNDKSDYERAIADYNQAISLDPKFATAYRNRASAYRRSGDNDRAIADYSQAISLDPAYGWVYRDRAVIWVAKGDTDRAIADLTQATALDPKNAYSALWLDIVARRNNVSSKLSQATEKLDMTAWPAPVIRLFLGQTSAAAVVAAADDPNADKKKTRVCEANFYAGELSLRDGMKDEASRLFTQTANNCSHAMIEWCAANAELKALGATANPSTASRIGSSISRWFGGAKPQ